MLDAVLAEGGLPGAGDVGRAVVGEDRPDGLEAVRGEEDQRSFHVLDGGDGPLVVVALDVGQAAVVVDGGVEVRVAGLLVGLPLGHQGGLGVSAVGTPSAAVGDLADLLHVDVEHVARGAVLVAADGLTGVLAGGRVDGAQPVQAASPSTPLSRRYSTFARLRAEASSP